MPIALTVQPRPISPQAYLNRNRSLAGVWWNLLAFAYMGLSYLGGLALIVQVNIGLNVLGVLSLTHGLVLSAYLCHELMHGSIFEDLKANTRLGSILVWLNGACYIPFSELARLHIGHHTDRVDFCRFDLVTYLNTLPAWQRRSLLALEWCYFPALAFLSRWRANLSPFWTAGGMAERANLRQQVVLIFLVRLSLFGILGVVSVKALLLYLLAYIGMITVLRFMDAFQHTYEVVPLDGAMPKRDRTHEQTNTYTNLLSSQWQWLNLLLLNFGYHNAHHELMKCPWYALPELERDLYADQNSQRVPLLPLLRNYHRFRVSRISTGQGMTLNAQGERSLENFYGGIEVSFLVFPA
jgi:fatty acid desaturase